MKKGTQEILNALYVRYPKLSVCRDDIYKAAIMLIEMYKHDGRLMVCGNGGSAADALHIVGELLKGFVNPRRLTDSEIRDFEAKLGECSYLTDNLQKALPAVSLVSETALITAYSNDMAADLAFAQQVYGQGAAGDTLMGISTSGNSGNVIYAAQTARVKNIKVISLTGESGGKLKDISDVCIRVPETETYKIQELHLPVYHTICLALEYEFFGENS